MKQLIYLLLLALPAMTQAQKINGLVTSGTHFGQTVEGKKWRNENGDDFTKAVFKSHSGVTYVTFKAARNMAIVLSHDIVLEAGSLDIDWTAKGEKKVDIAQSIIRSKGGNHNADGTKLALEAGKEYRLTFNAAKAKGTYFCQWRAL